MRAERALDKEATCMQGAQKLSPPDSVHCLLSPRGLEEVASARAPTPCATWRPWVSPAFFTCCRRGPAAAATVTTARRGSVPPAKGARCRAAAWGL